MVWVPSRDCFPRRYARGRNDGPLLPHVSLRIFPLGPLGVYERHASCDCFLPAGRHGAALAMTDLFSPTCLTASPILASS
jgi:hypothetical protein